MAEILPPIRGFYRGSLLGHAPDLTTEVMNNCRTRGTLEKRLRIGKRPGLNKRYAQQIGGAAQPIVNLVVVEVSS